jgi:diguanylate cyclase (GGDEF)-like protein/PAS domain S-box-containing protein
VFLAAGMILMLLYLPTGWLGGARAFYLIPVAFLVGLVGIVLSVLIEKILLARVSLLSRKMAKLKPETFAGKVTLPGDDELSVVAEGINRIIQAVGNSRELMREKEEQYRQLFEDTISANYVADPGGDILLCNRTFANLFGYSNLKEAMAGNMSALFPSRESRDVHQEELRKKKKLEALELELVGRDGRRVQVLANIRGSFNDQGELVQIQGQLLDISQRKKAEEELRTLAEKDQLTGLYNRRAFEKEMERLESGRYDPVGILVSDVDGLKYVNVTMGSETGNRVLLAAAAIVQGAFDNAPFIARIGGDEFVVLIPHCDRTILEKGGKKIREEVGKYNENHPELPLSISLGMAINSESGAGVGELLTEADNNMSREKTLSTQSIHSSVVSTLRKALEARDFITEGHASRVQELCERLARSLNLPERSVTDLRLMAQFHDIGKVGIPDRILMKPEPLTPEEAIDMQRHCEIGYRVALAATDLVPIADWILKHHEWWNGQGYPQGLKGDKIPMECRIMAVVDAYDVLTNDRPYRQAVSHAEAMEEIRRYAGIQFDPFLVKKLEELFREPGLGM